MIFTEEKYLSEIWTDHASSKAKKKKNLATCFYNLVKGEKIITLKRTIKFILHNKK